MNSKKKSFLRIHLLAVTTACLLITGCSNNEPSKEESKPEPEKTYNIVRPEFTPNYDTYAPTKEPFGVNMTYYSDIYSRGFAWFTDASEESAKATELYLVKSDKGKDADFTNATFIEGASTEINYDTSGNFTSVDNLIPKGKGSGSNETALHLYSHKVHVENLEKGKAYSYKIGAESGYVYGAFIVEKEQAQSITAVHMSDAQTKNLSKTNVWRNTFTKAVDTAGKGLDLALYNGDQFDQNNSSGKDGTPTRFLRFTKAIDVIADYKFDIPYMTSSGNHEPSVAYANYLDGDIKYAGFNEDGCFYSFDYQNAHFVVLNTNDIVSYTEQLDWLKADLDAASSAKWKIVMMHISPYSTGDHSNKTENKNIVQKLTPIFSEKHVDLVLQAHDHTYNKTLPYKWDAAGFTTTWNNSDVVNLEPQTETKDNIVYDKNPNGTYYVTTGSAGHRCGEAESDGIWAEVVKDGDAYKGLNPSKTFLDNTYKIELGKLTKDNSYNPYTFSGYTSSQEYHVGDLATGNVNAQMFGVLNITNNTLSYHVYTVNNETVKLFDTLDVLKD